MQHLNTRGTLNTVIVPVLSCITIAGYSICCTIPAYQPTTSPRFQVCSGCLRDYFDVIMVSECSDASGSFKYGNDLEGASYLPCLWTC
jgi:hypothetical protein